MKKLFVITTLLCILVACKAPHTSTDKALPEVKMKDISYGSFASSKMDVYLPAGRTAATPFAIVVHGGAWVMGDKEWGTRTQDTLLTHGIASVNINYRYADETNNHYPQLLADIDSALNFCAAHAVEWNTRSKSFVITGESAGAHLALLYGYTNPGKISTIIAKCAPTNFTDTSLLNYYAKNDASLLTAVEKLTGAKYNPSKNLPAAFTAASPVSHVRNIPTLFFHGSNDWVVPYSQAANLEKVLRQKEITYRFIPMPGAGHDVGLNSPEGRKIIYSAIVEWIRKYGK